MVEAGLGGIDSGSGAGGSFIAGNSNDSRTWIACAERDRLHELGWCYGRPNGPAPMNRRVCGERDRQRSASVDLPRRTARLADTKTGASLRPLSEAACAVISTQPRNGDVVFPSRSGERPIVGYRKMWSRIAKLGDLPADITPHVLRHSFASLAADLSYNEPTIATLLGHKTHSITSRYVHSADAVLLAAADAVAHAIMNLMARGSSATPVAGSAPRWISRVGRNHLFIGVFVPRDRGTHLRSTSDIPAPISISHARRIGIDV